MSWPAPDILTHEYALALLRPDDAPRWGPAVNGLPGTATDEVWDHAMDLVLKADLVRKGLAGTEII